MRIKHKFIVLFFGIVFSSLINAEEVKRPHWYVDVGFGQAFDSHLPSTGYTLAGANSNMKPFVITFLLLPRKHLLSENIILETGFLWRDAYQADSPYFPFVSVGMHYHYSNAYQKKIPMNLNLKVQFRSESEDINITINHIFLQNSLLANLKMDIYRWGRIMPYINLGLGASWNESKQQAPLFNLDDIPKLKLLLTSPSSSLQMTSFSYQVGAGLDFLVTENFWLSLGYNYNNFGRVVVDKFLVIGSGSSEEKLINSLVQPFSFRDLTSQSIQLTGRFIFG
jgi:opacity protein-like surface antigen